MPSDEDQLKSWISEIKGAGQAGQKAPPPGQQVNPELQNFISEIKGSKVSDQGGQHDQLQSWISEIKSGGESKNGQQDSDYDMAGAMAAGVKQGENGHWPDTYKKPSHITFSDESKYSTPETQGGKWKKQDNGRWSFTPSEFNLKQHSADVLKKYFKEREPGSDLILPKQENKLDTKPANEIADFLTSHIPNRPYAVGVAKNTPPEQRDAVLDAVYRLGSEKKATGDLNLGAKIGFGIGAGALNLGESVVRAVGLEGMDEDQKKFAARLHKVWGNVNTLHNQDAPWYDAREWLISGGEAAPAVVAAGGVGKIAGASAKLLGAGAKAVGFAGGAGAAGSFAPQLIEESYDLLIDSGVAPSTARWASTTSGTLQSLLYSALPAKILPKSWTGGAVSKYLSEDIAKRYAKTVLLYGPSAMAGAKAVDESIQDFVKGQRPDVQKYLADFGDTYKKSIGPMAVLAAPGALAARWAEVHPGETPTRTVGKKIEIPTEENKSKDTRKAYVEDQANKNVPQTEQDIQKSRKSASDSWDKATAPIKRELLGEDVSNIQWSKFSDFNEGQKKKIMESLEIPYSAPLEKTNQFREPLPTEANKPLSEPLPSEVKYPPTEVLSEPTKEYPKAPLATSIPAQYKITQNSLDDRKNEAVNLKMPGESGNDLEVLYPEGASGEPAIKGEYLGTVNGKRVMSVEAEAVNRRLFNDPTDPDRGEFTSAGNHSRYEQIPDDQIWVTRAAEKKEVPKFVLHEAIEDHLMKQGAGYDVPTEGHPKAAHDIAKDVEREWAAQHKDGDVHEARAPGSAPSVELVKAGKAVPIPQKAPFTPSRLGTVIGDLVGIFDPVSAGGTKARQAAQIMKMAGAQAAQFDEVAQQNFKGLDNEFYKMTPEERMDFNVSMDEGKPQMRRDKSGKLVKDGKLTSIASKLDENRAEAWERVQKLRGEDDFIENYFPRIYKKKPGSDTVLGKIMQKTFRKSGFLKKRTIPTLREGLDAGLELVTDNPVKLHMLRIHQMNEWVAKTNAFANLKRNGLTKFVPASMEKDYLPNGYEFVNDPAFNVQTRAGYTASEAYDKLLHDQLSAVASGLGIKTTRDMKFPEHVWGEATTSGGQAGTIHMRIGSPLSAFAHEIGHQIGEIYGVYEYMLEKGGDTIAKEMEKLAALRYEGERPTPEFKEYVQMQPEKEAVMLEAWLAAPEKMEYQAPTVTKLWREFLHANEKVRPLLQMDRSVVLGTSESQVEQPGIRVLGRWAMPREVAKLIKNQLSLGLRASENQFVQSTYKLARTYGNALNQSSLGLSGFHALFTGLDTVFSQAGLGVNQLARGEVAKGLKSIATSPAAPVKSFKKGNALIKAMRSDLSEISDPVTREIIDSLMIGGGRASMDARYANESYQALRDSFYELKNSPAYNDIKVIPAAVKTAVHASFSIIEATAAPVMKGLVPRFKLGVASELIRDAIERGKSQNLNSYQINEQFSEIVKSVENRLGQMSYDNLFWSNAVKDISQLMVRSTGWNWGFLREFGGAATDIASTKARIARGGEPLSGKQAYVLAATAGYATIGAALTYLFTGHGPKDLKGYFFPRTGRKNPDGSDEMVSLPTYGKDVMGWTQHPIKTLAHKIHPWIGSIAESTFLNEDFYGTEIRNGSDSWIKQFGDSVTHIGEAFIPFSIKNFQKMREAGEPIPKAALMGFSGLTSAPGYISQDNPTQLANKYLRERIPPATRSKEQVESAKRRTDLVRKLRSGGSMAEEDKKGLSQRQIQTAISESKKSPLAAKVARITLKQGLEVYKTSDPEQQKDLRNVLINKRSRMGELSKPLADDYAKTLGL